MFATPTLLKTSAGVRTCDHELSRQIGCEPKHRGRFSENSVICLNFNVRREVMPFLDGICFEHASLNLITSVEPVLPSVDVENDKCSANLTLVVSFSFSNRSDIRVPVPSVLLQGSTRRLLPSGGTRDHGLLLRTQRRLHHLFLRSCIRYESSIHHEYTIAPGFLIHEDRNTWI